MKISKILADIEKFESTAAWLNDIQADYGAENMYASSAENTLNSDMYVMREVFAMALGQEMLANHRKALERLAKKEN